MLWVSEFGPMARNKTECSVIGKGKLFIDYISLRSEKPLLEARGTKRCSKGALGQYTQLSNPCSVLTPSASTFWKLLFRDSVSLFSTVVPGTTSEARVREK